MRRTIREPHSGKGVTVIVLWKDHRADCVRCQQVDEARTATFVLACAEGSPLLMEHLVEVQRPEVKRKQKEVLEWAKTAGVFKIPRGA